MSQGNFVKNKHLLWRAGFGPGVEQLGDLSEFSHKEFYKAMVKASRKDPVPLSEAQGTIQGLFMGVSDLGKLQLSELNADQRKLFQAKLREGVRNLNLAWMREMVNSSAQMREKISLFWHGHFACRNLNVFYQQGLVNVIRDNALGNFRDLLHSVSKTAAMLNFLNNQQNKKDHPNENFAREVMELFTLGRGNYTERDIKESARAFTGWTANFQGDFIFRKGQHDTGVKTFLGKTGNFDGDEILDIILEQKQAARFISRKIYKFYVNENDTDPEKAEWLADRFYKSDYDISKLMEDIFTSEWFYDEKNMGINIKSPVELLVGIQRMLPMELENEEVLIVLQRILDQMLFYPPNVAGWPGGRTWIDSSSLMMRMRIPQLINNTDELNVKPKDDDDVMMGRKDTEVSSLKKKKMTGISKKQQINASVNWGVFLKYFEKTGRDNLIGGISKLLLQTKGEVSDDTIREYADESSRESFIKTAAIQIMSTPEYQLC